MKRTLVYILLITHLCSGLAFASDTHPEAMADHNLAAIDLLVGAENGHSSADLHHGDHCCHGAAHLVGLISNQATPCVAGCSDDFVALSQAPSLIYTSPLLRPPIA